MYENFYFEIVKEVLDAAIPSYCTMTGKSCTEVDALIANQIALTSNQHQNPEPNINYRDPLCRLGYLYVHTGVNATLFEETIRCDKFLSQVIGSHAGRQLSVCAVGGGPGTELLGLAKYCLVSNTLPRVINFTLLDLVPQWSESWGHLATSVQQRFQADRAADVNINRSFLPMDVTSADSYSNYGWLFQETDMVVFNYLLSENQVRLLEFGNALQRIASQSSSHSIFVIVDRLERVSSSTFQPSAVQKIVQSSGLEIIGNVEHAGCISDEERILAGYQQRFAGRRPRRWYRTQYGHYPTAFAIVARKTVA